MAAALLVSACRPGAPEPLERRQAFSLPGRAPIDVRLRLQPEHASARDRYQRAVMAALGDDSAWLAPLPPTPLTIVDPPWHGSVGVAEPGAIVLDRAPWWRTATAMEPELAAARAVSRHFLTSLVDTRALPTWFVDALAEIGARRTVVNLFEKENLPPGYAFVELRFFDRFVPLRVRSRRLPESSTEGVAAPTARALLAFGSCERWLGRPVFDQVVAAFVAKYRTGQPRVEDFVATANAVSGQDLSWLFDEAFGSSKVFDYGIASLTSEAAAGGGFATAVVVRRFGDAQFTGATAAPTGPFESGRGITIRVMFESGEPRTEHWDGRGREKAFHYRSQLPAVSAIVDPDRTILLDTERTNNSRTRAPRTAAAASFWAMRWMMWLEHALLTYGALV